MRAAIRTILMGGVDSRALAWATKVQSLGAPVSGTQLLRTSALVRGLDACGAWALTDDYAAYRAENSTQALVTLKQRIVQVAASSPTFVAGRGFLGNAAGVIKSGWNPSTIGQYSQNSGRQGFWCYAAPTVAGYFFGTTNVTFGENGPGATVFNYAVNNASAFDTWTHGGLSNLVGWHTWERTGATAEAAYLNTVQKGTGTATTAAPPNWQAFILGSTNDGNTSIVSPTDAGVAAACIGAPLTAAQKAGEYAAFSTYMGSFP